MTPRGIRNFNPLNIKKTGAKWHGLATVAEMTPEQKRETVFCVFREMKWGVRAGVIILQTYLRNRFDTVAEIINRWAPPIENQTSAYVNAVAEAMGVDKDAELDTSDPEILLPLVRAMVKHENGETIPDDVIMEGITLALGPAPVTVDKTPRQKQIQGVIRHAQTFAAGVALMLGLGLITQGDADALTSASEVLLTEENITAFLTIVGVIAGALGIKKSWQSPEKQQ